MKWRTCSLGNPEFRWTGDDRCCAAPQRRIQQYNQFKMWPGQESSGVGAGTPGSYVTFCLQRPV
jgi:hypothetical protein